MKPHSAPTRQQGLTLIELLVSLVIGLVILVAIGTAYLNTTNTTRQREDQALLNEPARAAIRMLKYNLSMAGYVDMFALDGANRAQATALFVPGNGERTNMFVRVPTPGTALPAPLGQLFQGLTPVFGCDGAMTTTPNAIVTTAPPAVVACGTASATRHSLQLAYQGIPLTAAALNPNNSLVAADDATGDGLDCLQRQPPGGSTLVINRFTAPAPAAGGVSQLMCEGSGAAGAQSIAEGVEEFVLRYQVAAAGVAANQVAAGGGQARYLSATEVNNATNNPQGWAGVTAVEICIVSATPLGTGPAAQGTAALQTTRPTCTRAASSGAFNANVARVAGDNRLWKRHISLVSVRNAVFATPL